MLLLCYRGLATWQPHSAFMRALMSSCWQPIRSERSDFSRSSPIFIPQSFFSAFYGLFLFLLFACLGPQQSQPVWHRCCPYWPLLFRNPWSGSGLGQWHHDTGGPRRMSQSFTNKDFIPQIPAMYLFSLGLLQSSVTFLFCLCSLFFFTIVDVPHQTLHQKESSIDHVQGVSEVPRVPPPCFPQAQGETGGPRPRYQQRCCLVGSAGITSALWIIHQLRIWNESLFYLWHSQASSGNAQQLAGFLLLRLKCLPWRVTRMHCDFTLI